jgi:hypothetical protein
VSVLKRETNVFVLKRETNVLVLKRDSTVLVLKRETNVLACAILELTTRPCCKFIVPSQALAVM